MGRYHPAEHDSFISCKHERCGARNSPKESPEYENECWRCGKPLHEKPQEGDVVTVDLVDEDNKGKMVGKTKGGFVLFIEGDVSGIEADVEVIEIESNYGRAIPTR